MATGQVNLAGKGGLWWRGGILILAVAAIFAVAFSRGCDDNTTSSGKVQTVKIGGKTFHLEVADTDEIRMKGLGQRDHIEPDGGMLFVFDKPHTTGFVMRDCPIDIDIIYLDQYGKVITSYQMKAEKPRNEADGEGKVGDFGNEKYESRLKQYPSRNPTQFVIEIKGGTLPSLNIKEGEKLELPLAALKSRAK